MTFAGFVAVPWRLGLLAMPCSIAKPPGVVHSSGAVLVRCAVFRGNSPLPTATYIVGKALHTLGEIRLKTNWNAIVRDYGPAVFGAAWRILGQHADAEDVTQEVFLEAYQLQRGQPVRNWGALLRRLAVCRALDRVRRRRPTLSVDGLSLAASNASPELDAIAAELAERLPEAISQLPEREGEVFCLRYLEDFSNKQIADALDMNAVAVAVALHKARAKLEALLHSPLRGEIT